VNAPGYLSTIRTNRFYGCTVGMDDQQFVVFVYFADVKTG
jgi:hypothetical protein